MTKLKKTETWLVCIVCLTVVFNIWTIVRQVHQSARYKFSGKVVQALDLIRNEYVDSISLQQIEEDAIKGMLESLDPHSQYIPPSMLATVNEPIEGNFSGVGIQFNMMNDTVVIVSTVSGGPSEKAGILAGDRLISAAGKTLAGMKYESSDIVKILKGKTGTKITVSVLRKDAAGLLEFELTRDRIPIPSVEASYMLRPPDIGYIKIASFSKTTFREFTQALTQLKEAGMKELVIDLRNNAGGLIEPAISIAELFLPEGTLLVYTEGINSPRWSYFSCPEDTAYLGIGLAVLINENTASASEILAGAIQDNDRGNIIGRRSFGKGLVQEQHTLSDGSALRITVARYYTPSGRCIQKPYGNKDDYFDELNRRYRHGELMQADSTQFSDSLKFHTAKGKTVYGGGGIMPHLFVPADTGFFSDYYHQIMQKGLIMRFALEYSDRRRKALTAANDLLQQMKAITADGVTEQFIRYAARQGVPYNARNWALSGNVIENLLNASILRNFSDNNAYYRIVNLHDTVIQAYLNETATKTKKHLYSEEIHHLVKP
ncbi:MAG: PDZ domain-containing protein [Bacteroidales bacterium]|jgi:carboxyl-terminal processing protease|nr:PDZ domain-containing protein [Bacteroidales bacterium]